MEIFASAPSTPSHQLKFITMPLVFRTLRQWDRWWCKHG